MAKDTNGVDLIKSGDLFKSMAVWGH